MRVIIKCDIKFNIHQPHINAFSDLIWLYKCHAFILNAHGMDQRPSKEDGAVNFILVD